MTQRLADQGRFHLFTGGIRSVQDTAMAMAAFPRQVITLFTVGLDVGIKQHTLIDKPLNAMSGITGDKLSGVLIHDTATGNQGIFYVGVDTVRFIKHSGNPALCIEGGAFIDGTLAENNHFLV